MQMKKETTKSPFMLAVFATLFFAQASVQAMKKEKDLCITVKTYFDKKTNMNVISASCQEFSSLVTYEVYTLKRSKDKNGKIKEVETSTTYPYLPRPMSLYHMGLLDRFYFQKEIWKSESKLPENIKKVLERAISKKN